MYQSNLQVIKLDQIRPAEHGFNAFVKIEEVQKKAIKRNDGTNLTIAEGQAVDETGIIDFRVAGPAADII